MSDRNCKRHERRSAGLIGYSRPGEVSAFPASPALLKPSATLPIASSTEVTRVLGLPLDQLDRELQIRVPWWREPLWFVPRGAAVEALVREGISRGRIWTVAELQDLLSLPTLSPATAHTVAMAKLAMDGTWRWSAGGRRPPDEDPCRQLPHPEAIRASRVVSGRPALVPFPTIGSGPDDERPADAR